MPVSSWSTTPSNNNSAPPNGAPEGMSPGNVNDVIRQIMADVRSFYDNTALKDANNTLSGNNTFSGTNNFTGALQLSGVAVPSQTTGSFTATFAQGFTTTPTLSVSYAKIGNVVTLLFPLTHATSNADDFVITGLPASLQPASTATRCMARVTDNGGIALGTLQISALSGSISVFRDGDAAWTTSGTKGLRDFSTTYLSI